MSWGRCLTEEQTKRLESADFSNMQQFESCGRECGMGMEGQRNGVARSQLQDGWMAAMRHAHNPRSQSLTAANHLACS